MSTATSDVKLRSLAPLGYRDCYLVGDDGRVWRRFGSYDREIEGTDTPDGYNSVGLQTAEGERVIVPRPRLILRAFIGPPEGKNWVARYRDGNPLNAALSNLYWGPRGAGDVEEAEESAEVLEAEAVL